MKPMVTQNVTSIAATLGTKVRPAAVVLVLPLARSPRHPARSPRVRRPPAALLGGAQQPDHRRRCRPRWPGAWASRCRPAAGRARPARPPLAGLQIGAIGALVCCRPWARSSCANSAAIAAPTPCSSTLGGAADPRCRAGSERSAAAALHASTTCRPTAVFPARPIACVFPAPARWP